MKQVFILLVCGVWMLIYENSYAEGKDGFSQDGYWEECSPSQQGVDSVLLEDAMQYLSELIDGEQGVKRAIVIRNGHVIWQGDETDSLDCVFSVSKSFGNAVLGQLIDNGKCSLETLAKDCVSLDLSKYPTVNLFHLATMMSGYNSEGETYTKNGISTPFKPITPHFAPEAYVEYNDHAAHLLGYVLTKISKATNLEEYFRDSIARPIGMDDSKWHWARSWENCLVDGSNPDFSDVCSVATGVWTSAYELAKFGCLFLNNGKYDGKQILSKEWVEESTTVHVPASKPLYKQSAIPGRYGYLWWLNKKGSDNALLWPDLPEGSYAAVGAQNNWCWVIPEWDMVVVRIGQDNPKRLGTFNAGYHTFYSKLAQSIITTGNKGAEGLGMNKKGGLGMSVYPNPSIKEKINVTYELPAFADIEIAILDGTGRIKNTWANKNQGTGKHHQVVDTAGFTPGIYVCRITTKDNTDVKKFIVQ